MEIDVEGKRAQARDLRGVSYDPRIDRFTAEIYENGVRRWLGSYITAVEAGEAYGEAAATREPRPRSGTSFADCYAAFRGKYGGDRNNPPVGAEMVYDGQKYRFAGVDWRKPKGGGAKAFFVWDSHCKTCGTLFKTRTPAPVSVAKGITRNCPEHAKGRGARKPAAEPRKAFTLGERAASALEPLGLLYDSVPLEEAVRVASEAVGTDVSLLVAHISKTGRLGNDPAPFRIEGDRLVFV